MKSLTPSSLTGFFPKVSKSAWLIIMLSLLLAGLNASVLDDAFISFRYAQNLVYHHDLNWNPGEAEKVEGYTNFLWVMILAAVIALGGDPVAAAIVLGLVFTFGTLLVTYRLALRVLGLESSALVVLLFLGANYSFCSFATGGLETALQTFIIATGVYLTLKITRDDSARRNLNCLLFSWLGAFAILTRPDSALIYGVLYGVIVYSWLRNKTVTGHSAPAIFHLSWPLIIVTGGWLAWKIYYYGAWLPNTYYAKVPDFSLSVISSGAYYLNTFLFSYLLFPFVFLLLFYRRPFFARGELKLSFGLIVVWLLYILRVGGDFMEFRLLVPILPLIFILIGGLIFCHQEPKIRLALIALVLCGALHHFIFFVGAPRGPESVSLLKSHLDDEKQAWGQLGLTLKKTFSDSREKAVIAVAAAGAIPYYSGFPTVDMLGLNDKWVAKHGVRLYPFRAGHSKVAPLAYLLERRVNWVIGHPYVAPIDQPPVSTADIEHVLAYYFYIFTRQMLPKDACLLEIPVNPHYKAIILYFNRRHDIDQALAAANLKTYPVP